MAESDDQRPREPSDTDDEHGYRREGARRGPGPVPDAGHVGPPPRAGDRIPGDDGEADSEHPSEEIRAELEELDELRDRHLRLVAEFENFRKRTRREMAEARERFQADLTGRLLEALDDLERFLESPPDSTSAEALREGVEMVHRKLRKELGEAGLSRMEAEGERFDPEFHEALFTEPVDDPEEADTISRVLASGYTFGDRVLRPARVAVAKLADADETGAGGGTDAKDGAGDGGDG